MSLSNFPYFLCRDGNFNKDYDRKHAVKVLLKKHSLKYSLGESVAYLKLNNTNTICFPILLIFCFNLWCSSLGSGQLLF